MISVLRGCPTLTTHWVWLPTWGICIFDVVLSLSLVQLFATPWTAAHQASLSFTISLSLLKLMSIELMLASDHLILCCPLLLLPSIFPSIRVFSNEPALYIRWPKYWSISSASALPMNIQGWFPLGFTGLIFLRSKGLSRVFCIFIKNLIPWALREAVGCLPDGD